MSARHIRSGKSFFHASLLFSSLGRKDSVIGNNVQPPDLHNSTHAAEIERVQFFVSIELSSSEIRFK